MENLFCGIATIFNVNAKTHSWEEDSRARVLFVVLAGHR